MSKIAIRRALIEDAEMLTELARRTFWDAYHGHPEIRTEDLQIYVNEAFSYENIFEALSDRNSVLFIGEINREPVGYAKLDLQHTHLEISAARTVKLDRLYTDKGVWGKGVGQSLMDACIKEAKASGCDYLVLSVWELSVRAQQFYRRNGFEFAGGQNFWLGSYRSNDFLMKRKI